MPMNTSTLPWPGNMGSSDTAVGGDRPVCPAAPELRIHVAHGRGGAVVVPRGLVPISDPLAPIGSRRQPPTDHQRLRGKSHAGPDRPATPILPPIGATRKVTGDPDVL